MFDSGINTVQFTNNEIGYNEKAVILRKLFISSILQHTLAYSYHLQGNRLY